jgi:hypothetical protein
MMERGHDHLPLEPLLRAYVAAGVPSLDELTRLPGLGPRFDAILKAQTTLADDAWLGRTVDGVLQEVLVAFYRSSVGLPLHAERLRRRTRFVRHGLGHLLHAPDAVAQKLDRCLAGDGPYFVAGLGPSFWSALVQAISPDLHPAWTPAAENGLRRLGMLALSAHERPAAVYGAILDAAGRIRTLAPELTALHVEHFLTLVALMDGRRLFAGAGRLSPLAPTLDVAAALIQLRAEASLRSRLKERGAALAAGQQALEAALAVCDGKGIGAALASADPEGAASCPLDWKRHGETLTLWVGRLWETDDPDETLQRFWEADPLPGATLWLPVAVLHLRDPQRHPVWNDAVRAGYGCLDDAADAGPVAERYAVFRDGVAWLRERHHLHPLEVPALLASLAPERVREGVASRFGGFCPDTFRFLHDLEANNHRAWMETQRGRYQFVLRAPLTELCRTLTGRYVEPVLRSRLGYDIETEARDGLALTRLTRNDHGRSRPYNTTFWIAFCGRDGEGKRHPVQLFVRLDAGGLTYGLRLGATTSAGRKSLRQRLSQQADALFAVLQQRGAFAECHPAVTDADGLRAWLAGREPTLARTLLPDAPLLSEDELAGDILLTFDRLLPLYAAALSAEPLAAPAAPSFGEADFRRLTYLDDGWLGRARGLLQFKKQIILQGVPGTGKTHVARCLARLLAGDDPDAVCLAQMHAAYSYEEFVEGIKVRSVETNGRHDVTYPVEDGLLCAFAARAAANPSRPHVLLLDEINRANLPRVLGELLYLLEYRDQEVTLPYSRRRFRLPPNLHLVGTMNATDRSVALVDQALRRRFSFVEMPPDAAVLRAWLRDHPPAGGERVVEDVVRLFESTNARLRADLGPSCQVGHSYFMVPQLDESRLRAVWQHQVRPLLEEYAALHPGRTVPLDLDDMRGPDRRRRPRSQSVPY